MKKIIIFFGCLFSLHYGWCPIRKPLIGNFSSQAVYVASATVNITRSTDQVVISSYACLLHNVLVSSQAGGMFLSMYNSNLDTATAGSQFWLMEFSTNTNAKYPAVIPFDIFLSSGLAWYIWGPNPVPPVTVTFSPFR